MTYREHFEKAKREGHEWAEAAIRNTRLELIDEAPITPDSLSGQIACAFQWDASPEGRKYWSDIYKALEKRPAGTGRV